MFFQFVKLSKDFEGIYVNFFPPGFVFFLEFFTLLV